MILASKSAQTCSSRAMSTVAWHLLTCYMQQLLLDPRCTGSARAPKSQPSTLPSAVRDFGFIPDFDDWRPGDLLLVSKVTPGVIERQIVSTQLRLGHAGRDARWHHAAVYIGDGYLCEARPGGVRYHPVVESVDLNTLLRIRRNFDLNGDEPYRIAIRALMRLSRPYSFGSIAQAFFQPLNPGRFVVALQPRRRALICSQLFHDAYAEVAGTNLVDRLDKPIVPSELSATSNLNDVQIHWVRLS